jgi:hypothetical protein
VRCRMDDACAYDGMGRLWPVHAMPLAVALMAVGGALNVGNVDFARDRSECLTCTVGEASVLRRCGGSPTETAVRDKVGARRYATLRPPYKTQILSGAQTTKLSAFGIFTLGSVSAFITSFSPMILLSARI